MDPLVEYMRRLCIENQNKQTFTIDVAKVSADLSTTCIVLGHGHIIRSLSSIVKGPHITTVSKDGSQITVEIIRK